MEGLNLSIWALSNVLSLSLLGLSLSYCWDTARVTQHEWRRKPLQIHASAFEEIGVVDSSLPDKLAIIMESLARVKKSLRSPIRSLTSCVTGGGKKRLCARQRVKRGSSYRGCRVLRKTPPFPDLKDPSVFRSYQADLEKERQVEAVNQKQTVLGLLKY